MQAQSKDSSDARTPVIHSKPASGSSGLGRQARGNAVREHKTAGLLLNRCRAGKCKRHGLSCARRTKVASKSSALCRRERLRHVVGQPTFCAMFVSDARFRAHLHRQDSEKLQKICRSLERRSSDVLGHILASNWGNDYVMKPQCLLARGCMPAAAEVAMSV